MRQFMNLFCLIFFSVFVQSSSADNLPQRPIITTHNVHLLEQLTQFERGSLMEVVWTPDGQYIYVNSSLGLLRFNPQNLTEAPTHFYQYHYPLAFSSDNRTAASLDADGNIVLWDFQTGEFIELFYDISSRLMWITDLAFSPDGSQLAMGFGGSTNIGLTGAVTVWDTNTRDTLIDTQPSVIDDPVYIDYSSDGTQLAAGGYSGLAVWDTISWEILPMPYSSYIANLEYNSNGNRIVYWDWRNRAVRLFDLDAPDYLSCIPSNSNIVGYWDLSGDVAFSPIDNDILAVSQYGILSLWNVASCELLTMIPATVDNLVFSPDGSQLVGVESSGIHIYSADSLEEIESIGGFIGKIHNMAFSNDSDLFAYSLSSHHQIVDSVHVWDTDSFSENTQITLETDIAELDNVFLSDYVERRSWILETDPDIQHFELYLRASSTSCKIEEQQEIIDIIEANTQSETLLQNIWDAHVYPGVRLCISPDQRTLVTADQYSVSNSFISDGAQTIRVWDIISGEPVTTLSQIPQYITWTDLGFSPDGRLFFVSQWNQVTIWDSTSWEPVAQMEQESINKGLFTLEADMFITQNHWGDITFWNIQTGTVIRAIDGLGIDDLLLSPNGELLALRRSNNTIELWGIPEYP